ncbi:hypothetical protein E4U42_002273 [Claviceps africana]|uniref:Protein kinase domain-containing protein n=1 Tax=Claviceps africana TaxID=83212 RepID=A0A8K0NJW4_9HYPO|nr:hypothetical protein E4U42_002273 [Claviceps africana]
MRCHRLPLSMRGPLRGNIHKGFRATVSGSATPPLWDEERAPDYDPETCYPARIGETIRGKYRLISKLGWGTASTVALEKERHVALKITNSSPFFQTAARNEIDVSNHMWSIWTRHPGQDYFREVLDSFEIEGAQPGQTHLCIAFELLRESLLMFGLQNNPDGVVKPIVVKALLPCLLEFLDFMHTKCHVIHTDLKPHHIMLPFEDAAVLKDYVRDQEADPAPYIVRRGRPVYQSRPDFGCMRNGVGFVKVTDFGCAVRGDANTKFYHDIQPLEYTAPEVMLRAGWSYPADIWNLGLVLWDLMAGTSLLDGRRAGDSDFSYLTLFAQMIRLLGPPPSELLSRANKDRYSRLFKHSKRIPDEDFTFSNKKMMLDGQDKILFIQFAKRMLCWLPEERSTAKELLDDQWLRI